MKQFFFDTANVDRIKTIWESLKNDIDPNLVVGITTNPNAFIKVNTPSLNEWLSAIPRLCETVSEIRGDDKGVVYVQGPNSNMSETELLKYAEVVSSLSDGNTKVGLKIPPYKEVLKLVPKLNEFVDVNVTGIADATTALKCATYAVRYISIIPGRMEEVGIDAKSQIEFVNQGNLKNTEIITGSMRTLEGLIWAFQYATVPTIGERVWNLVLQDRNIEKLLNIDYDSNLGTFYPFSPRIDERNYDLSKSFFEQMDECGKTAYSEINKL